MLVPRWIAGQKLPVFSAADTFLSSGAALPRDVSTPGLSFAVVCLSVLLASVVVHPEMSLVPLVQEPSVLRGWDCTPTLRVVSH